MRGRVSDARAGGADPLHVLLAVAEIGGDGLGGGGGASKELEAELLALLGEALVDEVVVAVVMLAVGVLPRVGGSGGDGADDEGGLHGEWSLVSGWLKRKYLTLREDLYEDVTTGGTARDWQRLLIYRTVGERREGTKTVGGQDKDSFIPAVHDPIRPELELDGRPSTTRQT